jgi:hypothetical protein
MRWSHTRLAAAAFISLFILSFLSWKINAIPNHLPEQAHHYFYPDEPTPEEPPATPLCDVIQELLQRPILSYDESVKLNSETCPTEGFNIDGGAVQGNE